MDRPKVCLKCKSENLSNDTDEETSDGLIEYWVCIDCGFQYGVELKVIKVLSDEEYKECQLMNAP